MLGRPQFAQRVKRWMHKYKIDTFFDYLMGTPFDFHAEDEKKYSGCLLMGNYQKRRGDDEHQEGGSKRRRQLITDRPILMAGSRKRMPGESLLLLDKREEEDDDDDEERVDTEEEEMDDDTTQQPMDLPPEDDDDDDDDDNDNEEDELASTSSTTAPSSPSAGPTCASCLQLSTTVQDLQSQLSTLTHSMAEWQAKMEAQTRSLQQQVVQLMDEQTKAAQTRKKLAHALLADPL
jgi:hypothetical protein